MRELEKDGSETDETTHKVRTDYVLVPTAPVVHFDDGACFGVLNGVAQIELVTNAIVPLADGKVEVRKVEVARLRCSVATAASLKAVLEKVLQLAAQAPGVASPETVGRMN